jgi:hypothetical protein
MALHGGNHAGFSTQGHCTIQQQLSNSELGQQDGIAKITHCRITRLRTCPLLKHPKDMPADPCSHPQHGKCPAGHPIVIVWQREGMGMQDQRCFTNPFQPKIFPPTPGIMDGLSIWHRNDYACVFRTADEGYYAGRVAATTQNWKTHWGNWTKYV